MKVKLTDLNDWIEAEAAGHLWIGSTAKGRAMCDQTPNLADLLQLAKIGLAEQTKPRQAEA